MTLESAIGFRRVAISRTPSRPGTSDANVSAGDQNHYRRKLCCTSRKRCCSAFCPLASRRSRSPTIARIGARPHPCGTIRSMGRSTNTGERMRHGHMPLQATTRRMLPSHTSLMVTGKGIIRLTLRSSFRITPTAIRISVGSLLCHRSGAADFKRAGE